MPGPAVDDEVLRRVSADTSVRVLVLVGVTGASRWTVPGLCSVPVPVIASVSGTDCDGRVLAADIAVAGETATFACRHPLTALDFAVWTESVGIVRARWLALTGERLDARTAYEWGAVGDIARAEEADGRAALLAAEIASGRSSDELTRRVVVTHRTRPRG